MTLKLFFESQSREQKKTLMQNLAISPQLIDHWTSEESAPRPETAFELIEYTRGVLSWEGIYLPYVKRKLSLSDPNQQKLDL